MNTYRFLLLPLSGLLSLGLLAGCAPDTLPPTSGSADSASPTTGGSAYKTPEDRSVWSSGSARTDARTTTYSCDNGQSVTVKYPDANHALVSYQDQQRPMHIAVSADGARYVGQHYEWWTRGSGTGASATLFAHANNATGSQITTCQQQ